MANKIIHKHSVNTVEGKPKLPTIEQLDYGEIAINYADGFETISFKNSNDEIVEIKSNEYYENIIEENEELLVGAVNELNEKVNECDNKLNDKSPINHTHKISFVGDVIGKGNINETIELIVADDSHNHTNYAYLNHTHISSGITDSISESANITSTATGLVKGKAVYNYAAPKNHASTSTTYGVATTSNYGHVKISNGDVATVASANGLVAGMNHTHSNYSTTGHTHSNYSTTGHTHVSSAITDSISSMTGITETATGLVQGKAVYELINDTEEQIAETLLEHDTRINNILVEIENNELVTATAITNLDNRTTNVENGLTNKSDIGHTHSNYLDKFLTNILYSDLVSLKNESKLVPGMQYRITDYVTTCAAHGNHYEQVNTYSAGHNFDIIVIADTVNTINENARAIQHEGDTYFANCNLSAWELKYTLDNNPEIFRWANTENGKGVIYYMKDENNNECMYDFKNIQYDIPSMSILDTHWIFDISKYDTYSVGFEPNKKYYTFSYVSDSDEILDGSIVKIDKSISIAMDNKIGIANPWQYIKDLPVIVLLSLPTTHEIMKKYNITARNINSTNIEKYCEFLFLLAPMERNYFGQCNRYNIIGPYIFKNNFGDYMLGNFMESEIIGNFIKNNFQKNNIGITCVYNVIESSFINNTIGNNFIVNHLGSYSENNVFGYNCFANQIGNYFTQNNIGNYFESNNIGNDFCENTIGDEWWGNIIGNDVCNNIFGSAYNGNNFGNYFHNNKFVMNNNSDAETLNNVSYCIFNNNITYNVFYPDVENFTQEDSLINLHVHNSIHGSEEEYNYIGIPYINNDYEINISKNSNNELKMYCEADLIA